MFCCLFSSVFVVLGLVYTQVLPSDSLDPQTKDGATAAQLAVRWAS